MMMMEGMLSKILRVKQFYHDVLGNFLYLKYHITIGFDSTFRLHHVTDFTGEQPKREIHEDEIKQEIREVFAPVIDAQPNLGSIFSG